MLCAKKIKNQNALKKMIPDVLPVIVVVMEYIWMKMDFLVCGMASMTVSKCATTVMTVINN